MAITTQFLPEQMVTTSYEILKEFIYSFIPVEDLDILDTFPTLDESYVLTKPLLILEDMGGNSKGLGLGKQLSNGDKGRRKTLTFMASWVISSDVGGTPRLRSLADVLQFVFEVYESELRTAGLDKPKCSSMRTISPGTASKFWGGRHQISVECLIRY